MVGTDGAIWWLVVIIGWGGWGLSFQDLAG